MTDGGFRLVRTPSAQQKNRFLPQWRAEEGQSGRTFQPQRPHNSTWTRGGRRHQGVKLDFQRRAMNYLPHLFNLLHLMVHIAWNLPSVMPASRARFLLSSRACFCCLLMAVGCVVSFQIPCALAKSSMIALQSLPFFSYTFRHPFVQAHAHTVGNCVLSDSIP